jgi:hypothetical protein
MYIYKLDSPQGTADAAVHFGGGGGPRTPGTRDHGSGRIQGSVLDPAPH